MAEAIALFSTPRARDGGELLEQFGLAQRRRSVLGSLIGVAVLAVVATAVAARRTVL